MLKYELSHLTIFTTFSTNLIYSMHSCSSSTHLYASAQRLAAGEYRFSVALGTWTKKEPQGLDKLEGGHTYTLHTNVLYIYNYIFLMQFNALVTAKN